MRRFLVVHDHVIVARGVTFTDGVAGLRWGEEPRMTLVFMDSDDFTEAINAAGRFRRGVSMRWVDPPEEYL